MRAEVDDPERGTVVMPGVPVNLTASPGKVRGQAPALGQHDEAVSARAAKAAPDGLPPISGGPLAGFRILDMGTFVAGPYAGALLAELGADVVKVEAPSGDPFRVSGFAVNRGMRSMAVNLRDPAGLDAFRKVAAGSDVLIEALRPGVTAKLGIGHETLATVHPGIITVSLSAYGEGPGPLRGHPGVDMVVQGMSGMMTAQGGDVRSGRQHDRDHRRDDRGHARPGGVAHAAAPGAQRQRPAGLGIAGRHRDLPAGR